MNTLPPTSAYLETQLPVEGLADVVSCAFSPPSLPFEIGRYVAAAKAEEAEAVALANLLRVVECETNCNSYAQRSTYCLYLL